MPNGSSDFGALGGIAIGSALAEPAAGSELFASSFASAEGGTVGGTCVNTGCVPSKALLAAAEARHIALDQPFPGIRTEAGPVDVSAVIGGVDLVVTVGYDLKAGQKL